jgi:hypothetical protein
LRREQAQLLERLLFADAADAQRLAQSICRHDGVDEIVERVVPERAQHGGLISAGADDGPETDRSMVA